MYGLLYTFDFGTYLYIYMYMYICTKMHTFISIRYLLNQIV
jgi:hypothetical protein